MFDFEQKIRQIIHKRLFLYSYNFVKVDFFPSHVECPDFSCMSVTTIKSLWPKERFYLILHSIIKKSQGSNPNNHLKQKA